MATPTRTEPAHAGPSPLPVRTTMEDVLAVCGYLAKKPTGATLKEMKAVVGPKSLEARKLNGIKRWGLIEEVGDRTRVLDRGRRVLKEGRAEVLREVLRENEPYLATVERAGHTSELTVSALDVAAHWHENFGTQVSGNESNLNEQVLGFFQLAEGAKLGRIVVGRRGQPTRFEFDQQAVESFLEAGEPREIEQAPATQSNADAEPAMETMAKVIDLPQVATGPTASSPTAVSRVFVTHGKNVKVLEQVKRLLRIAKFDAVVAQEHETPAKPVPDKVMDDMRSCQAAVIHVGSEGVFTDAGGKQQPHINANVLIEIGAAMALYHKRFILLVEDGLELPSNLQGLYQCRYKGDELSLDGAMKLAEALDALR